MKRLLPIIGIILISASIRATDRYVVEPGTIAADQSALPYNTWTNAATNIQWAVDAAAAGETIWVSNGVYLLTNQVSIYTNLAVRSINGPSNTIVNGNYPAYTNRCFYISPTRYNPGTVTLDGFTITNGYPGNNNDGGGVNGIYKVLITNCIVTDNRASGASGSGAGVYLDGQPDSIGTVKNSVIRRNTASSSAFGGGMHIQGYVYVFDCIISDNSAYYSGGMYVAGGGAIISNCTISGNNASDSSGGGIFVNNVATAYLLNCLITNNVGRFGGGMKISGSVTVRDCTISRNRGAATGGGVLMEGGSLRNCLISSNAASYSGSTDDGGGLYMNGAYPVLNCTIVGNTATRSGGGVYGGSGLTNCVVYYNYIGGVHSNYNGSGNWSYSCTTPAVSGEGNITNAPQFVDAPGLNYRLTVNSPCVNTGTNQSWMTTVKDLDGHARILYGTVDMGAYETIYEGTIVRIGF